MGESRQVFATLDTDDRYPGYAVLHPAFGIYIPALFDGVHITPCPAYGDKTATFWFGNCYAAWDFIEKRISSPVGSPEEG